jgi:hypothetical protein
MVFAAQNSDVMLSSTQASNFDPIARLCRDRSGIASARRGDAIVVELPPHERQY